MCNCNTTNFEEYDDFSNENEYHLDNDELFLECGCCPCCGCLCDDVEEYFVY